MSIESIARIQNAPVQQPRPQSSPVSQAPREDTAPKPKPLDMAQSKAIVADIQNNLQVLNNAELSFSVHEASGNVVVIVTDADTGKVIREIPPKETLKLAEKLEEMMGLIFDQAV